MFDDPSFETAFAGFTPAAADVLRTATAFCADDGVVVTAVGELDITTVPSLRASIDAALDRVPSIVIDLTALRFTDVTGAFEFARAAVLCSARGERLSMRGLQPSVERVARLLELDACCDIAAAAT